MSIDLPSTSTCTPLAAWAAAARPSALQAMLSVSARPEILSFALGLPAPELFPIADLARAATAVLSDPMALQYSPPIARLKDHVCALMAARSVSCTPAQVFLTAGAQQGMSLLTRLLLEPHSRVIVETLTYTGFRQVLEPFAPEIVEVPTSADEGIDTDALARVLAHGPRPALIYAMSHGHNPLGISMPAEKRARLVELAAHYGVPVIEDDAYGFLQYGDAAAAPLRALDGRWVCYVGSFSKILAPGLRQGWLVVPESWMAALSIAKESSDINTRTFNQLVLTTYLETGLLPGHVDMLRREYRSRRDAMLHALRLHLPEGARWRTPTAGLFVWIELESRVCTDELLRLALEREHVAFLPGRAFSASGAEGAHCMRLNFSRLPVHDIEEGIRRLGRAVNDAPRRARD
jgi:2-aminoadipate transaminase